MSRNKEIKGLICEHKSKRCRRHGKRYAHDRTHISCPPGAHRVCRHRPFPSAAPLSPRRWTVAHCRKVSVSLAKRPPGGEGRRVFGVAGDEQRLIVEYQRLPKRHQRPRQQLLRPLQEGLHALVLQLHIRRLARTRRLAGSADAGPIVESRIKSGTKSRHLLRDDGGRVRQRFQHVLVRPLRPQVKGGRRAGRACLAAAQASSHIMHTSLLRDEAICPRNRRKRYAARN